MGATPSNAEHGFARPDWNAPLDVQAYLNSVPPEATVKGMFIRRMLEELHARGHHTGELDKAVAFKDYPLRRLMEVEVEAAKLMYPDQPLREGLRRLGWLAYPTFRDSLVGRVMFGALGDDMGRLVGLVSKAYNVVQKIATVEVIQREHDNATLRLSGNYNFPNSYQVGIFEGVLQYHGHHGDVLIRTLGPTDVEYFCRWS